MTRKKNLVIIVGIILLIVGIVSSVFGIRKLDNNIYYNAPDDGNYYVAKLNLNGATSIEQKTIRCKKNDNGCYVTLPSAIRDNGIVLGYSDTKDDKEPKYNIGDEVFLTNNVDIYVISYQENTLTIASSNVDFIETSMLSCKAYNSSKTCKVTLPLYNKNGYENKGYSTSSESLTGFIYAKDEYEISKDTIIYPIYSTSSRHQSINVVKTFTYGDSFIEIESGCRESVYQELLSYLDEINVYTPYMLIGNKITFLVDDTFDEIWGSKYVGMNYGPKSLRSVDIRCSSRVINDYYATMVHEMSHSWDFYYAKRMGDNISSQSDVINLYNKYKVQKEALFREYSYSNLYEFTADMMRYYYFKYYVARNPFIKLDYPNDVKETLEKYICISKNDYTESLCKG